jgi:predicted alpha/beta superfamily hydrolase
MRALSTLALAITATLLMKCSSNENREYRKDVRDRSTIRFAQYSESVKDTFFIDIQLPKEYFEKPQEKYPTIILVDGNFYFPIMSSIVSQYEIAGLLEPVIVVGVGYKSFKTMDSLRVRDYLFPKALPSDEMNAVGGGEDFYNFLTKEVIPKIDSNYRTDTANRMLLGHSFGGYFVLYGLFNQLRNGTSYFKTFISASPALWYNNFYLNQLPELLEKDKKEIGLFISVGEMEDSTWSVKPVKDITTEIQIRNIKGLEFRSMVYDHLDHMDVAVLSFTKGLQELMVRKGEAK